MSSGTGVTTWPIRDFYKCNILHLEWYFNCLDLICTHSRPTFYGVHTVFALWHLCPFFVGKSSNFILRGDLRFTQPIDQPNTPPPNPNTPNAPPSSNLINLPVRPCTGSAGTTKQLHQRRRKPGRRLSPCPANELATIRGAVRASYGWLNTIGLTERLCSPYPYTSPSCQPTSSTILRLPGPHSHGPPLYPSPPSLHPNIPDCFDDVGRLAEYRPLFHSMFSIVLAMVRLHNKMCKIPFHHQHTMSRTRRAVAVPHLIGHREAHALVGYHYARTSISWPARVPTTESLIHQTPANAISAVIYSAGVNSDRQASKACKCAISIFSTTDQRKYKTAYVELKSRLAPTAINFSVIRT